MLEVDFVVNHGTFRLAAAGRFDRRVTGLFGASGAGKTTCLHAIAGLVRPDGGRIALDGRTLFDAKAGVDVPAHRRRVGVVFQDARLFPHLSVRGNLEYGRRLVPSQERRFNPNAVIELLEIDPLLSRRVRNLSGGERQRVSLGRALLSSPRLLLLDEPLASIDRGRRRQILPFLLRVRDELDIPMLYVSHELGEVLQLTDHLMILDRGGVAGYGRYIDLALDTRVWAHDVDLVNVLEGAVGEVEGEAGTTRIVLRGTSGRKADAPGTTIRGPLAGLVPGERVTVSIRPQDVALARQSVDGISIQNQLRGRVTRLTDHHGRVLVEVDVGVPLLASIAHSTLVRMEVAAGMEIWCLVKVNAMQVLG